MIISAEAAATSLNSYITFKEQLRPVLKGGNTLVAMNTLASIAEAQQPYGAMATSKRPKRSKTSFDHNNSMASTSAQAAPGHHFLSTRRDSLRMGQDQYTNHSVSQCHAVATQQHSRESSLSSKPRKTKKQRSIVVSAVDSKENEDQEERLLEVSAFTKKNEGLDEKSRHHNVTCRASAETQAVTVAQPMTSITSLNNVMNNSSMMGHSLAARGSMAAACPKNSSQISVLEIGLTCAHNPSQQALQQLMDTHQDLGIMSIYDQSDAKSQAQTNTAELMLREENMMLRVEILKLKKALFMKSQNLHEEFPQQKSEPPPMKTANDQIVQERTTSDAIFLSNFDEREREEGHIKHSVQQESSRKQTPLARMGSNGILEEVGSSYNNSEVPTSRHMPRFQDHPQPQQKQPNFTSHQQPSSYTEGHLTFNKSEFMGRHCMSTVDEQREENNDTTTKELDDLEKFLKEQGIQLGTGTQGSGLGGGGGRNFEQPKSQLSSSVYEQKRHYEQEIQCLKKDLEAIEMEEQKIKQKLSEQSTIILEQCTNGGQDRSARDRSFQNEINRQSLEQMNQLLMKPINVAFDSFLERRDQQLTGVLSPIDHASVHRLSDEAPLIILNHHLERSMHQTNLPSWQPPSFSNSHSHSLKASPNIKDTHQPTFQMQNFVSTPFKNQDSHQALPKQQLIIIPELTLSKVVPAIKGRARRNRYSQRNVINNIVSGMNSEPSDKDTQKQVSSRLNTEQIDQMFEDPTVQSQFLRLDTDEQPIMNLLNIQRDEENDTPLIAEYIDQHNHRNYKLSEQETDSQLVNIKQSIKGVLHKYELSFQKPVVMTSIDPQQSQGGQLGIPRLSTIKEDSPDFGYQIPPISENSDIVNHKSIIVNGKLKGVIRQKSANATSQKPKIAGTSQKTKNPSKSPKRPLKSANQVQYLEKKKKLPSKKQGTQIPTRSTSPYNSTSISSINQMNHILNQAYMDIVRRKQRDILENRNVAVRSSIPIPTLLPNPSSLLKVKQTKPKTKGSKKVSSKSKENIKYLSNVINKKEPSRNFLDNNFMSNNYKQSVLTHHLSNNGASHQQSLQALPNPGKTAQSKSPKPLRSRSRKSKASRSKEKSPLKLEDQQYDLLWSKQVVQKRMTLMRQKEDSLRKKIEDKMSRIEEFQRRKEQQNEERKNRSKSKSPGNGTNGGVVTTMSEFECTPYSQSKIMLFERHGLNTIQPSATQSSAVRSPRLQNMKVNMNKVRQEKEQQQSYYQSYTPSGMTTNVMSKQNSDRKNKTQEVDSESTPVTVNKNWGDQYDFNHHHGGSFMSGTNLHRYPGMDPNITSSTSTVVVTANNCQVIESQATLRNTFQMSQKSSTQHSRSNSGSRVKIANHKKQSSLSNPQTESVLTLNKSQTQSILAAPHSVYTKKGKRETSPIIIIGDNDLMRQFLSNPSQKSSKLKKFIMQAAQEKEVLRSQNSLFKLHKIECNTNQHQQQHQSQHRLLEPIFEDL